MMRFLFNFLLPLFLLPLAASASGDTTNIPIGRQIFHDYIKRDQRLADKADGRLDGMVKVGTNQDVNVQVTDAIYRKINVLRNDIEMDSVSTNNDKVRYLRYVDDLLKNFIFGWRMHQFNPSLAPLLVDNFEEILFANIKGQVLVSNTITLLKHGKI